MHYVSEAYRRKGTNLPKWQREVNHTLRTVPFEPTKAELITESELAERRRIEAAHGDEE